MEGGSLEGLLDPGQLDNCDPFHLWEVQLFTESEIIMTDAWRPDLYLRDRAEEGAQPDGQVRPLYTDADIGSRVWT